jgi:hypothetical protein
MISNIAPQLKYENLQLFRKVIDIYSVDNTKSINDLCGKTNFLKLRQVVYTTSGP